MPSQSSPQRPEAPPAGAGAGALQLLDAAPVVVLLLDRQGRIEHVNACFERLTGWRLGDIRGRDWLTEFIPPRDRERIGSLFGSASRGEPVHGHANPIVCRDGSERVIEWHAQSLTDEHGAVRGVLSIGNDVTERQRDEQRRLDEQRRRDRLLQLARELETVRGAQDIAAALAVEIESELGYGNVWILLADDDERRYRLEGAVGDVITRLPVGVWSRPLDPDASAMLREVARADAPHLWEDAQRDPRTASTTLAPLVPRSVVHLPLRVRGRTIGLLATGSFGAEGVRVPAPEQIEHLVAMAGQAAAALDRIRFVEVLQRSDRRLREAQALAQLGSWELDLADGRLLWSDEIYRIFEIDSTRFGASYEAFLAAIHPDDRAAVDAAYRRSVATRQPYAIRHRLRMADGRIKWVEERGETTYAPTGEALRSSGTMQDITRLHLEQQATVVARRQLQMVIDAASQVAITAGDADGTVVLFNKGAELMLGYTAEEVIGRMSVRQFHRADELQARADELSREYGEPVSPADATRAPARRGDFRAREWTYVRKDGSHLTVSLAITVMLDARG